MDNNKTEFMPVCTPEQGILKDLISRVEKLEKIVFEIDEKNREIEGENK